MTATPIQNEANIKVLRAELSATRREFKAQLKFVRDTVDEIKDNHLVHIADDLKSIKENTELKLSSIYKKLNALDVVDTKGAWLDKIGEKIVETLIIAILVAVLVMVGLKAS